MTIETSAVATTTEANRSFSEAAKLAEKKGLVVVFKNNCPKLQANGEHWAAFEEPAI